MSACFHLLASFLHKLYGAVEWSRFVTLAVLVTYSLLGAGVFVALENGPDTRYRTTTIIDGQAAKEDFVKELLRLSSANNLTSDAVFAATEALQEALDAGPPDPVSHWTYWNSLLFAGTIYTTIGYGNFACETGWGRIFTLVYAIFGIPLALVTLNDIGVMLLRTMNKTESFIKRIHVHVYRFATRARHRYHKYTLSQRPPDAPPPYIANIDETTVTLDFTTASTVSDLDEVDDDEPCSTDVSVWMSLCSTILFIFFCSMIFCLWEGWTFGKAFYFFFISLTTIGLGDVVADDPKHMVIVFGLVIVGLAMVSVCINSIQAAMERLYIAIMKKILTEYTRQINSGQDEMSASLGMMQMFQGSVKGKVANMLLSKDKKKVVLQKVEEEAKAEGLVVPEIFHHVDPVSGLPDFISSPKEAIKAEIQQMEEREKDPEAYDLMHAKSPKTIEVETQTEDIAATHQEKLDTSDFAVQTTVRDSADLSVQTLDVEPTEKRQSADMEIQVGSLPDVAMAASQTILVSTQASASQTQLREALSEVSIQTTSSQFFEAESQTSAASHADSDMQTAHTATGDSEIQTRLSWYSLTDAESQFTHETQEISIQTFTPDHEDTQVQTFVPEIEDTSAQVEPDVEECSQQTELSLFDLVHKECQTEKLVRRSSSLMAANLKQFEATRKFSGLRPTQSQTTDDWRVKLKSQPTKKFAELAATPDTRSKSDAEDSEEEEHKVIVQSVAPTARLRWDPFDGRHVEEQKPVHALKSYFDKKEQKKEIKTKSKLKRRSTTYFSSEPPTPE